MEVLILHLHRFFVGKDNRKRRESNPRYMKDFLSSPSYLILVSTFCCLYELQM